MSKPCFLGFDIPTCCVHQYNRPQKGSLMIKLCQTAEMI